MKYTGVLGCFVLLAFLVVGSNGAVLAQSNNAMRVDFLEFNLLPTADEVNFPYCSGAEVTGRYGPSLSTTVLAVDFDPGTPSCIVYANVGQEQKDALNYNIGEDDETLGAVDWVLVELRSVVAGTTISEVYADTVVVQKPGLLLSNGIIVDAEGYVNASTDVRDACLQLTDPQDGGCDDLLLNFPGNAFPTGLGNDVYVVVRHRFHLDIMSANPVVSGSGADLTQISAVYDGGFALQPDDNRPGVGVMVTGDADGNQEINSFDIDAGYTKAYSERTRFDYNVGDSDMNAEVNSFDIDAGYTNAYTRRLRFSIIPGDRPGG